MIEIDWLTMFMKLAGGLALFLYGMDLMVKGLLSVAGDKMKNLLSKLTHNRITGALSGAVITAVIQSSSVTSVLVVGFVSAGLMTVAQSASVIMGANLGTTITAQIVAFKVTHWALLMIAIGFAMQFVLKSNYQKSLGELILGLGLIFFGMDVMSNGMKPLRSYQPFLDLMVEMQNPFLAMLVGFAFTAAVQSSSATIGIVIVMASSGFLSLPAGIAIALGANIGTCVTALLSTLGKSREAVRTALVHVQFNVFGVLIWLAFIPELSQMALWVTYGEALDGVLVAGQDTAREIANANTIFNLINLIIFLPMIPVFIWVINKLVPVLPEEKDTSEIHPKFLDDSFLPAPTMAFDAVKQEIDHFREKLHLLTGHIQKHSQEIEVKKLLFQDKSLEKLRLFQRRILRYLGKISQEDLDEQQQQEYLRLITMVNLLESMLDGLDQNILQANHQLIENKIKPSETMHDLMHGLAKQVFKSMDQAILSLKEDQQALATEVFAVKTTIDHLIQDALKHQAKHFDSNQQRMLVFRLEMQIVDGLKHLHTLSKRVARLNSMNSMS